MASPYMKPGVRKWDKYLFIEPKIRELLILLHAKGFQTIVSCEGHEQGTSHRSQIEHVNIT